MSWRKSLRPTALASASVGGLQRLRTARAGKKRRGNPFAKSLRVSAGSLGVTVEATLESAPDRLVLVQGSHVVAALPTERRGTGAQVQVGADSIARAVMRSEEHLEERDPDEPTGFSLRLGWAWPSRDGEIPEWCSSVILADGTVVSRGRWAKAVQALAEAADPDAQAATSHGEFALSPDVEALAGRSPAYGVLWVGRAENTDLSEAGTTQIGTHLVRPYVNRRGYISIAVDRELKHTMTAYADRTEVGDTALTLQGRIRARHDRVSAAELVVRGRRSGTEFAAPVNLRLDATYTRHDAGRSHYAYDGTVDFPRDRWTEIDAGDNFDVWLRLQVVGVDAPVLVRVNKIPFAARLLTRGSSVELDGQVLNVAPYYTFKAKALSLKLEVFDADVHAAMVGSVPPKLSERPVWIIGEMPYKAQDNGLAFFRWMRAHHPEIDAYYVIEPDSVERRNLGGDPHVIDHGSREHVELALNADRFIGTHHAEFLYPSRNADFVKRMTGSRIFLQHGVMGTKWMVPNYGKRAAGFETELFLASSEREKKYLVHDFGFEPEEVVVTGLSRFDRLLGDDVVKNPRRLLIMPTWRDWLQYEDAFLESDYFLRWRDLLTSDRFAHLVRSHDLDVVLCLHPNMQKYTEHFRDVPARVVSQGEENVQDLMMSSACMVTDYSSVGFDFSFQHRPVVYYQFDRDRFLGPNGSHLDLDAELPGLVEFTESGVLRDLERLASADFEQPEELRRRADVFLDHRDRDSNERVYHAVLNAPKRAAARGSGELSGVPDALYRRFRRNRFYFPLMKWMSRAGRLLPVQEELMIFESGLGKQYADSPRYIYEELLRRGDERKKVWIYSGPHRFSDPNTTVVKRLSPSYYWNLARAGFITTNQNLPFYLKRHRKARYVQTWHGTPLKRMQHDIAEITGREDDYLQRVEAATAQWTDLLSPSPYASAAFRSAFQYSGPILEAGYPRNDELVGEGVEARGAQVRLRLGIPEGTPVVLYAPTFRDDQADGRGRFGFQLPFDLHQLLDGLPEGAVLLLRMHVLVAGKIEIPEDLAERVMDVSRYPEIQELYLASDALVTDYSSVFFDAALLRRPIVFHAFDLDLYRDQLRGFYLDYERDVPGPITRTTPELAAAITRLLREGIDQEARTTFLQRFAPLDDGHAAGRVVDALYGKESQR